MRVVEGFRFSLFGRRGPSVSALWLRHFSCWCWNPSDIHTRTTPVIIWHHHGQPRGIISRQFGTASSRTCPPVLDNSLNRPRYISQPHPLPNLPFFLLDSLPPPTFSSRFSFYYCIILLLLGSPLEQLLTKVRKLESPEAYICFRIFLYGLRYPISSTPYAQGEYVALNQNQGSSCLDVFPKLATSYPELLGCPVSLPVVPRHKPFGSELSMF